jgi:ribonuclease R
MVKKRFSTNRTKPTLRKHPRRGRPEHLDHTDHLADNLLQFLAGKDNFAGLGEIILGLDLPRHERKSIKDLLIALEKRGKVLRQGNSYKLSGESGLIKATLELNSRGFGFAQVEGATKKDKDPFISRINLNGASQGDTVLIRLISDDKGRPEARVVKILHRGISRLCGVYTAAGKSGYLTPDNDRLPFTLLIRRNNSLGARSNTAVLAEILDYGEAGQPPEGKILEILGDPMTAPVQLRMAIEQFELPRSFPSAVEEETGRLKPLTKCEGQRTDLRHIPHVTIDGETAKDFDDAIAVEETAKGYRLYVSIADVSHYVRTGSAIDLEAYRRGTSVYFPELVIPMLPERLSNDLCSLVPDQDRPAFTAILDFNGKGQRTGEKFCKSMIRSQKRFTYTTVRRILYDREPAARKEFALLLPMLEGARVLADLLWRNRMKRGSIGFDIPEPEIILQGEQVASINRAERNLAHKLIEEFMLAANEAVAETMDREQRPVLYRIHDRPDPLKVEQFTQAITAMGLQLPPFELSPSWFAGVVEKAKNSPAQYVINNLMLRTMQQARYSPDNSGHFGLAAEFYLHFTSPIRRYPDLVAHRVLEQLLITRSRDKDKDKRPPILADNIGMGDAALHLSKRERVSVDVERNTQARLSALFLKDRIGEEFAAIISGVSSFGMFVELLDSFISGAVPLGDLADDYYILDSRAQRLIGERTGRIFQMGKLIQVRLVHVDMLSKKITFAPLPTTE